MTVSRVKQLAQQLGITDMYVRDVLEGRPVRVAPWVVRAIEDAASADDLGPVYRVSKSKKMRRRRDRVAREAV